MELRPNPIAAAPAAAPGKDTDPGSALPAGPARAAGGTGTCSTATIGTRIISRSGAGSTSGIGTGTETGTGTTETGIWQEVVFNGLYLLTSTRMPCPRLLRPIPVPSSPPQPPPGGTPARTSWPWESPPPLLLLPGAIPLRSVDTRTQREMVLLFHGGRFVSPSQSGGEQRRRSPPRAAWGLGDAQLPILGSGAMCHPLDCLGTLASPSPWWDTVPRSSFAPSPSRSWEKGAGAGLGVILSIPTFPTAAFPPKRQLRPLPQSLPCFRGSGRGRAGCDPLVSPQNPKKERQGEPRRVRMSRDTLGDFQGWNHTQVGKPRPWKSF